MAAAAEPYCMAFKCRTAGCKGYRWADVAERNGETRCIRCQAPFPQAPVRMPFHRKGPPSAPRGKGAAQADAGGKGGNGNGKDGKGGLKTVGLQAEVNPGELSKWSDMMRSGVLQYMRVHPDRFHRRVRRGIPPQFRWQVWKAAIGLPEGELPEDILESYRSLCDRKNRWTSQIEIDMPRTFPEHKSFDAECQHRLRRVLNAYAEHNPDVGYCQGMNYVAGLLLIVSNSEEESFAFLIRLMEHTHSPLGGFYGEGLPLLKRYVKACDKLVGDTVPELRDHFQRENVRAAMYLHQWFLSLFINSFPLTMVMVIWDVIVCEGLPVILRIAVSILQVLKDSLLAMHIEEIIKFFKMMKTYDDEDGELNAFRIGQLLMKHTEHVEIPAEISEYLSRDLDSDELANLDYDESWDVDLGGGSWFQSLGFGRMFPSFWRRSVEDSSRRGAPRAASAPELGGAAAKSASPAEGGSHSANVVVRINGDVILQETLAPDAAVADLAARVADRVGSDAGGTCDVRLLAGGRPLRPNGQLQDCGWPGPGGTLEVVAVPVPQGVLRV